jgi:hypothetical protein
MGLPAWQTASAVRLSFGPAADEAFIAAACERIRACGRSLRESCLLPSAPKSLPPEGLTRFIVDGACCYLLADAASRRCVVVDPLPELTERLGALLRCQRYTLAAVLDTHSHGDHASSAADLRAALPELMDDAGPLDALGWPQDASCDSATACSRACPSPATPPIPPPTCCTKRRACAWPSSATP